MSEQQHAAPVKEKRPRDPEKWIKKGIQRYRKGSLEFRPGAEFFSLADAVITPRRTLLGYDRLYVFWQAISNLQHVPGGVVEVGAFRGGSAWFIASALAAQVGEDVPFDVFDTFEGHPAAALSDRDTDHKEGQFSGTSFEDVKAFLSPFANVRVHKRDILEALPDLPESPYRLVHIDTDLYLPTMACLEYFTPRLSPGAVVVLDDYTSGHCPGVRAAAVEYLKGPDEFQVWDLRTEQLTLVKR
jgi:cephalosporin hydroxylase